MRVLVTPLAQPEQREVTFGIIQLVTNLCITWSSSLTKRVIQAAKAIYDFVIYLGCEIGKHNYTI